MPCKMPASKPMPERNKNPKPLSQKQIDHIMDGMAAGFEESERFERAIARSQNPENIHGVLDLTFTI